MKRRLSSIVLALLLALALPRDARGQYYTATVLHHPSPVGADVHAGALRPDQRERSAGGVAHTALVGAAVGAGVGLVAAVVATTQPSVTDHSEDGIAYVLLIGLGAGLGLATGALVGLLRQ